MKKTLSRLVSLSALAGTIFLAWCDKQITIDTGSIVVTGNTVQTDTVEKGDTVEVTYTAMLPNGIPFKKTENNEVLRFVVWSGTVIKGLEMGVIGMKVNTTRTLEITPDNAYASEYDITKVKTVLKTALGEAMKDAKEGAYIKVGNIEATIKWFTKDEQGMDLVVLETNPPYTYTTLSYTITIKKLEKNATNK